MAKATENKIKVSELIPDDKNFNKGSEFGQGLIEKSFEKFGAGRSILIDKNNKIIAGNKSTENYGALGGQDVIVVESDGKQLIAVKRTDIDLDTAQGREMALADNATAKANIVWAEDIIAEEIGVEVAESWGIDMGKEIPEAEEDDFDTTPPEIPITVLGDLYEIGEHRLLCGDSTDSDQVAKLMNGEKAEIVFTSPPYNLGKNVALSTRGKKDNAYEEYNDDKDSSDYLSLLKGFTNSFFPYCQYLIVNIQSLANNKKTVIEYQNEYKNFVADIGIWYKSNPQPSMAKKVMNSAFEYFIFLATHENPSRAIKTATFHGTFSNVYKGSVNSENVAPGIHSAAFPLSMCIEYLRSFCSDNVIDCFMGTGTTMVAAHQLKRKCYGMELDPKYCDVIVRRMLKLDPTLVIKRNGEITTDFNNA